MSNELFSPRQDIVFKMLFGSEGSTDILTAFLKAVLPLSDDEYAEVTLLNPISTSDFPDDKICILDVKVETAKGRIIDVEIQVANKSDLRERIVYYLSKMVTEQVGKGESYLTIKPSVCILITDFVLVPENARYHNRYRLRDFATGSEFTDLMEVNTLELPKLPDNSDGTPEWFWLAFLKDDREEVYEVLSDNNPDVKKA
ncbi:MAG: Rpn family recombination-promoting nuclease/putative transposase, partial [Azoarcus sp.]|nr:Rpn family recombination-promoting nuclease/putative transposase [Azoarcus sp.]